MHRLAACLVVESAARMWLVRMELGQQHVAATKFQSCWRGSGPWRERVVKLYMVRRLQNFYRVMWWWGWQWQAAARQALFMHNLAADRIQAVIARGPQARGRVARYKAKIASFAAAFAAHHTAEHAAESAIKAQVAVA